MRIISSLLPLIFIFWTLPAFAFNFLDIKEEEFLEIKNLGQTIMNQCPPEECFYMGLGRSPSAVIAYLELYHPQKVKNLPLSGFRGGLVGKAMKNRFRDYIKRTFEGKKALMAGKRVVLIDYSVTGGSLGEASKNLGESFSTWTLLERPLSLETVAFTKGMNQEKVQNKMKTIGIKKFNQIVLDHDFPNVLNGLVEQKYDDWSEFGSFYLPVGDYSSLARRKEYGDLLGTLSYYDSMATLKCGF